MSNTSQLESIINSAIIHGDRIQENGLGTILPTDKELREMDRHWAKQEKARRVFGAKELGQFDERNVGGEVRYYDGESRYAIVSSRSMRVLWFIKKADGGWYAA
jgi:hypothetical protein